MWDLPKMWGGQQDHGIYLNCANVGRSTRPEYLTFLSGGSS